MTTISLMESGTPLWYEARFGFNRPLIDKLKQIPGAKWNPDRKCWMMPRHAIPVLHALKIPHRVVHRTWSRAAPIASFEQLRPYQQEAAVAMLNSEAFILAFAPRVGKTPTATVAAASQLAAGLVRTVIVLYPNVAREVWEQQFPAFAQGLPLFAVSGSEKDALPHVDQLPFLVLGMHYEMLSAESKGDDGSFVTKGNVQRVLNLLKARGPYTVIADEPHLLRNRKSPRTKLFIEIGQHAAYRWALTGTPQRNYPRDLFPLFEFLQAGSVGSYSKFTTRYADGHMGDYGWIDDGSTNEEELNARLSSMWIKKSRADVAPWLPKLDRSVVLVQLTAEQRAEYDKKEAALGLDALNAMNDANTVKAIGALRVLADLVSAAKMTKLVERARFHALERKVKVLVFAYHHETLNLAWDVLTQEAERKRDPLTAPVFVAGGWMVREKRGKEIERWKATPGPAILLVNSMSSGVGIDLADAEVAIGLEAAWVPADFVQMESRIEDVHLGKRKAPGLLEYLLAKNTIDEDMVARLISKLDSASAVIGHDSHTGSISQSLRGSGVVDRNVLTLGTEDPEVVAGALDALRSRLMGGIADDSAYDTGDNNDVESDDDDEVDGDTDDDDDTDA